MIVGLLFMNMIACCVMSVSAVWLVTDRARGRWPRVCLALVLCGAMVNIFALWSAFFSFHPSHPVTWPPEAMLNRDLFPRDELSGDAVAGAERLPLADPALPLE